MRKIMLILGTAALMLPNPALAKRTKEQVEMASFQFSERANEVCRQWQLNQEKYNMATWFLAAYQDETKATVAMISCYSYIAGYLKRVTEGK